MREASAAYDATAYARCLEVLGRVADHASPGAVPAEAERLRRTAEAALAREQEEDAARREANRRASQAATEMRDRAERSRRSAEAADAARHQAPLWDSAETRFTAGLSALAEEAYAQGESRFEEARQLYARAEAGAREAQAAKSVPATAVDTSDETVFVDTSTVPVKHPAMTPAPARATPAQTQAPPVSVRPRTLSAPTAPELERAQPPAPLTAPRAFGRPRLSAPARRYLTLSMAGGLALALIAAVVWLAGGRDAGRAQRENVEQLRGTVLAARDRAIKADAVALTRAVLSRAEAAQAEGERLSAAGNLAAATQAYQEAAERYGEAERQAQVKREQRTEADAVRAGMLAAKQRASSDAADFPRAVDLERKGNAAYAQLSFADATTSFRAAGELFAKALPAPVAPPPPVPAAPPAPPALPNPRAEIRALLDNYVRAFETKDVDLMRRVRPGLTDDELRRVRATNEIKRSHKVDLRVYEITITGDEAKAQGRREDIVVLSSGQRLQTETSFAITLKHGSRGWVINEVRESADKPAETRPPATRAPRRPDASSR
jgi:hypothetical protein